VFEKPRKTSVKEMASEQGLERMDRISTWKVKTEYLK
jgi:hypothetical protein